MGRVDNKTAIITGGAKGIGKAACSVLAEHGAKVAVTDVDEGNGRRLVEEINSRGGTALFWNLNTSHEGQVERVTKEVYDRFGAIHVLVNNAGISGENKPTHEITVGEWDAVMDVNAKGLFLCIKYVIPYMQRSGGGSIINLSSIYGIVGAPDMPPYHASKGAIRIMTKTDALLYAKDNIRINSIHPGYIWTSMVEELAERSGQNPDDFKKELAGRHPIGHVGDPEDIAYGILYLASEESKFVTGSELVIDGGYTAQ